jgi:hypothetical protein
MWKYAYMWATHYSKPIRKCAKGEVCIHVDKKCAHTHTFIYKRLMRRLTRTCVPVWAFVYACMYACMLVCIYVHYRHMWTYVYFHHACVSTTRVYTYVMCVRTYLHTDVTLWRHFRMHACVYAHAYACYRGTRRILRRVCMYHVCTSTCIFMYMYFNLHVTEWRDV